MKTKAFIRQKGVWHQKHRKANYIPKGLRALDTDASWSTSKYRGWVYGYGLHLTTPASGFPRLARVYTAFVSEKAALDQKIDSLVGRWKDSKMLAHYAKAELAERGTIARFKYGKGR